MWRWLVLVLTGWVFSVQASELTMKQPAQWLNAMHAALQQQNYQGVIVYGMNNRWDSLAITHANIDGEEYERLEILTRKPKERLRHGAQVTCHHEPTAKPHSALTNPLAVNIPQPNEEFSYQFSLGKSARIAGRMAQELRIQPQDRERFAMSLWLDKETALLLRLDILDDERNVLERAQYAQISLGKEAPAEAFVSQLPGHEIAAEAPKGPAKIEWVAWNPSWLPTGFKLTFAAQQAGVVRLMYSDGLAAFSIFVDDTHGRVPEIERQWGATHAVLAASQTPTKKRITAVGELPAATLKKIAHSMLYLEQGE